MRIVYAGTPEFAVPALRACVDDGHEIPLVLTQPDRPAGRGRRLQPSAVKQAALSAGLPVAQPLRLDDDSIAQLAALQSDLMIVAAYGLLLPQAVLDLPRFGCVNIHASLLPRWRGASPIQHAILAGDLQSGLTLMQMDAGLDTGPVLLERRIDVDADDTAGSLHDRLAALSPDLIRDGLDGIAAGRLSPTPQSSEGVSHAPRIDKQDGRIDWSCTALEIERRVRGYNPWPVAFAELDGERVRIWAAAALPDESASQTPGQVLAADADGIRIACGRGVLRVDQLQWPGGRVIDAVAAANGRDLLGHSFG